MQPKTHTSRPLYTYRGYGFERVPYGVWVVGLAPTDDLIDIAMIGSHATQDVDGSMSLSALARTLWRNRCAVWGSYRAFHWAENGVPSPQYRSPIDGVPWEIHEIEDEAAYVAARDGHIASSIHV